MLRYVRYAFTTETEHYQRKSDCTTQQCTQQWTTPAVYMMEQKTSTHELNTNSVGLRTHTPCLRKKPGPLSHSDTALMSVILGRENLHLILN